MKTVKTDIIPISPIFAKFDGPTEIDFKAICIFTATGFFLDKDTYWKNQNVLQPASNHTFDKNGTLISSEPYFQWHYSPRNITFDQALDEFSTLFENIIHEQINEKSVILPLSGGLDSRTQAVALKKYPNVTSFSYEFTNGYPETGIAKKIANTCGFKFSEFEVPKGYLWDGIEDLADINQCYSEFTHPRQMAFIDEYKQMGEVFSLGHWGDVLFDSFNLPQLSKSEEIITIEKKILQKGGLELASGLWKDWGLGGSFEAYLRDRIGELLSRINIEDTNAKLRAFKSLFWAPRWTSVNANIFAAAAPISLPYFDNRMCEFICTIPEDYLKNRKLQIAYIKQKAPELSKISWQEQKPFNLNNFHLNKVPYNLPYRILNKLIREFNGSIGRSYIARNWELQFLGTENDKQLKRWLFDSKLDALVSNELTKDIYTKFKENDAIKYSHPVSILLTLSLFNKKFANF